MGRVVPEVGAGREAESDGSLMSSTSLMPNSSIRAVGMILFLCKLNYFVCVASRLFIYEYSSFSNHADFYIFVS